MTKGRFAATVRSGEENTEGKSLEELFFAVTEGGGTE
jgi:hypothetical protein